MDRRSFLAGGAASLLLAASDAAAMGRVPLGGSVSLSVPWATNSIDPHDLFDPLAAIFANAIADPVYTRERSGNLYPALADGMPRIEDGQTVVRLRRGLRSGKGKAMGGRDLAWSVTRARRSAAAGLLAPLQPFINSDPNDPLVARFGDIEPTRLAVMLSSPLVALVPVGFSPTSPDGTGSFIANVSSHRLELTRNRNAARGPSYLQRVVVRPSRKIADGLRAFESGRDQVGWLGLGLHRNRSGARKFDAGQVGWVVLVTGKRAGRLGTPGAAQQLANAVPVERLHLGLTPRRGLRGGTLWQGSPTDLIFAGDSGHLAEIAEAVAVKLSQTGHEVTAKPVSRSQLRRARRSRDFTLALDVVRHPGGGPTGPLIALATADRPSLGRDTARKLPNISYNQPAHHLTTRMRIGVLGGLAVRGGVASGVMLAYHRSGHGIALGASYRGR